MFRLIVPSTSVSLLHTFNVTGVSSLVVATSLLAVGGQLVTGLMIRLNGLETHVTSFVLRTVKLYVPETTFVKVNPDW